MRSTNRDQNLFQGERGGSGRVSDSGARYRGFETYLRRVVFLSMTFYSPKVLVIPRKWWLSPNMTEKLLTGTLSLNTNKQKQFSVANYKSDDNLKKKPLFLIQGLQHSWVFVVNFLEFLKIKLFYFVVDIFYQVHNVASIFHLNCIQHLEIFPEI